MGNEDRSQMNGITGEFYYKYASTGSRLHAVKESFEGSAWAELKKYLSGKSPVSIERISDGFMLKNTTDTLPIDRFVTIRFFVTDGETVLSYGTVDYGNVPPKASRKFNLPLPEGDMSGKTIRFVYAANEDTPYFQNGFIFGSDTYKLD